MLLAVQSQLAALSRLNDKDAAAKQAAAIIEAGKRTMGQIAEAHANRIVEALGMKPNPSPGETAARVTSMSDRIALTRKAKDILTDPFDNSSDSLGFLAEDELDNVTRAVAARVYTARKGITGYRRVVHPELSRAGTTCGLCIAASQRFYHKADLAKIHDNCHCAVVPIVQSIDPGQILNSRELAALYKAAGGTDRESLKNVRFTPEGGDLGKEIPRTNPKTEVPANQAASA